MPSIAPQALCQNCTIQPDYPSLVLSNGTYNITSPEAGFSRQGFLEAGLHFTAYTFFQAFPKETGCGVFSYDSSLSTPFFVPTPTTSVAEFWYFVAETPFVHDLNLDCAVSQLSLKELSGPVSTFPIPISILPTTYSFSSSSSLPAIPAPTGITAVAVFPVATPTSSPPSLPHQTFPTSTVGSETLIPTTQTPPVGSTETKNLTIGLVVAIIVPIILISIGLSSLFMIRKQRRRKEEATAKSSLDAGKDESENPQLYFQQKAELDDEQRRHEMEALELVHEMEGDDRVHEMAGDEDRRGCGRQELSGEEHAGELDGLR